MGIEGTQIELADQVHDQACQVVERQGFTQPNRQIECGFVIGSFEWSGHACILPLTG